MKYYYNLKELFSVLNHLTLKTQVIAAKKTVWQVDTCCFALYAKNSMYVSKSDEINHNSVKIVNQCDSMWDFWNAVLNLFKCFHRYL